MPKYIKAHNKHKIIIIRMEDTQESISIGGVQIRRSNNFKRRSAQVPRQIQRTPHHPLPTIRLDNICWDLINVISRKEYRLEINRIN